MWTIPLSKTGFVSPGTEQGITSPEWSIALPRRDPLAHRTWVQSKVVENVEVSFAELSYKIDGVP
jgi:hypothetical protein